MMAAGVRTESVEVVVTKRPVATAARAWPQLRGTSPPTLGAATGQTGQAGWAMGHGRESNALTGPGQRTGRVFCWRRGYVPPSAVGRGLRWFSDRILLSALLGSVDLAGRIARLPPRRGGGLSTRGRRACAAFARLPGLLYRRVAVSWRSPVPGVSLAARGSCTKRWNLGAARPRRPGWGACSDHWPSATITGSDARSGTLSVVPPSLVLRCARCARWDPPLSGEQGSVFSEKTRQA
jgi:hypothetical protein